MNTTKITIPMNITVVTATITLGHVEVPVTKAIVNQLPHLPGTLPKGWNREDVKCFGSVELPDEYWYLYSTPGGVHRSRSLLTTLDKVNEEPQRIILVK